MTAPRARRDAADSRERLLTAAAALFVERGYDGSTVRDIGRRAGVDPALIARYFGSKTGLYVAALAHGDEGPPADLHEAGRLAHLLERWRTGGTGPVLQAVVRSLDDESAQTAAEAALEQRLVAPLRARYAAAGADDAVLRAEVAVAAVAGVALARRAGALPALAAVSTDALVPLLERLLAGLEQPAGPSPDAQGEPLA